MPAAPDDRASREADRAPIRLILRPLPSEVPLAIRLRRALKLLLRAFGLRCTKIEGAPAEESQSEPEPKE